MLQSKLSFLVRLAVIAGVVALITTCGGTGNNSRRDDKASFHLEYNNTWDQPGDNTGGGTLPEDITLVWTGSRVGSEDTFNETSTWTGIATDPWYTTHLVTNLKPGNWNLSVTVNGQTMSCPSPIALSVGPPVTVAFQIDKVTGQFAGCN